MITPQASVASSGAATLAASQVRVFEVAIHDSNLTSTQSPNLGNAVPAKKGCTCAQSLACLLSPVHSDEFDTSEFGTSSDVEENKKMIRALAGLIQGDPHINGEPYINSYLYMDGNFRVAHINFERGNPEQSNSEQSNFASQPFEIACLWHPNFRVN
ncbi:hypothetical protein BDZ89DRAFT_1053833 [Hymenopellis radicata]|nr:hypothetical protein BDZ89DRAFT_1053833 [Hymenopellis radicata]